MDSKFLALENFAEKSDDYLVPCAIRLKAPDSSQRIPTHFILLLDVSESMSDDNKLSNVKRCAEIVLQILTDQDRISLITFGENAKLHLNRVVADETHKVSIRSVIQGLVCDGCTNLSAGLGYVREVCEGEQMKTGLLLLTDGHANRGVSSPESLRTIFKRLHDDISILSLNCIAYGSDHNAELLRGVAEDSQGTYVIVNTIEDTAMAFGDTLGGLLSCAFQNVAISIPLHTNVHGPYTIVENKIVIGDIYSGTSPLLLVDISAGQLKNNTSCLTIKGIKLPEFTPLTFNPIIEYESERQLDVETTRLRYKCTSILKDLKDWISLSLFAKSEMTERITNFENLLQDSFFSGNILIELLKNEVTVMRETLGRLTTGFLDNTDSAVMSQHITSLGLARGFSTPMAPQRRRANQNYSTLITHDYDEDTETEENPTITNSGEVTRTASIFQNSVQMQISELLVTASRQ
jgi:hypothetical protein